MTALLILALGVLARTIKNNNSKVMMRGFHLMIINLLFKVNNNSRRMRTGIENDVKLYEDHSDCVKHVDTGYFVSNSILI